MSERTMYEMQHTEIDRLQRELAEAQAVIRNLAEERKRLWEKEVTLIQRVEKAEARADVEIVVRCSRCNGTMIYECLNIREFKVFCCTCSRAAQIVSLTQERDAAQALARAALSISAPAHGE